MKRLEWSYRAQAALSPVAESGVIGQSADLSSEDVDAEALVLAVTVTQAPKNSKEAALCEQVYNLKRYPLELRPYNSMASKKER